MQHARPVAALVAAGILSFSPGARTQSAQGDAALGERITAINQQLRAAGRSVAVEQIEFFTIGVGRPSIRLHQTGTRWVANDPRREADGENLAYLVDQSDGATASGLTAAQTEAAIDRAFATWQAQTPLQKVLIVKRPDTGADPDLFDFFYGFGGADKPLAARI